MGITSCTMTEKEDRNQIELRFEEALAMDASKIPLSLVIDASKCIFQISFIEDYKKHIGAGFFIEINENKCLFTNCHQKVLI